jgi:hypothetical protein
MILVFKEQKLVDNAVSMDKSNDLFTETWITLSELPTLSTISTTTDW